MTTELLKLSLKELWNLQRQISWAIMLKIWPIYAVVFGLAIVFFIMIRFKK